MSAPGVALLVVMHALGALGCGTAADEPYAGLAVHRPPGNEYLIRYLAPPWRLARAEGSALQLLIERDGTSALADSGLVITPKYLLDVTVAPASARALADADVAALPGVGETLRAGPRAITTDSGDTGFEVLAARSLPALRYKRYVSLDSSRAGAVRLVFEANPDLDDPEITQMIRQCDVAPEAP